MRPALRSIQVGNRPDRASKPTVAEDSEVDARGASADAALQAISATQALAASARINAFKESPQPLGSAETPKA